MKRNILPPGIISLAVVFVCLCLTVLSLLCYTSAKSELSLAEASAANKKKVLEGSFMCRGLADTAMALYNEGYSPEQAAESAGGSWNGEEMVFEWGIDENRVMVLTLDPQSGKSAEYLRYVGTWTPDTGLEVWDGQ